MVISRYSTVLPMLAIALLAIAPPAATAARDVEDWVTGELADYVHARLTTAPRFDGTSVQLVVFADDRAASRTNELALALRNGLRRSLAGRRDIRLSGQPDPHQALRQPPMTAEDCAAMRPDVLIGIEVRRAARDDAVVRVRALDDADNRWVPDFGREWRGRLTSAQQRALDTDAVDRSYLGRRDVPYDVSETDLIASHLARDLRCKLMRRVSGEYRLAIAEAPDDGDALAGVPKLVSHQVGGISSLRLLAGAGAANSALTAALHPVDGRLYQYWLVLEPDAGSTDLQPLASSVYVEMNPPPASVASVDPVMPASTAALLSDMRLVRLSGSPVCLDAGVSTSLLARGGVRCAALRVTAADDAVVFLLNHQQNLGLVRLADDRCAIRPRPYVLRRGESLTVRLPDLVAIDDATWSSVSGWPLVPGGEVYFAIASADDDAAREIARHVSTLPARCSDAVRPGLDGAALTHWLYGLKDVLETRSAEVAWRAVRTRSVL